MKQLIFSSVIGIPASVLLFAVRASERSTWCVLWATLAVSHLVIVVMEVRTIKARARREAKT
jgi:hypothetical protein